MQIMAKVYKDKQDNSKIWLEAQEKLVIKLPYPTGV